MKDKVIKHINELFASYEQNDETNEIKEELISNMIERINDLVVDGYSEADAYKKAVNDLGTKEELKQAFNFKMYKELKKHPVRSLSIALVLVVGYLIGGFVFDVWHPTWIIFPVGLMVLATFNKQAGALWLVALALYLVLGFVFDYWWIGLSVFGLATALVAGSDEPIAGLWVTLLTVYLALSLIFTIWHPLWLIFLLGTSLTVLIVEKSIVGFNWVFSITLYLGMGVLYNLWHPGWIIFIVAAAITVFIESGNEGATK